MPMEKQPVIVTSKSSSTYTPGRRSFVKYRELGVTEATQGRIRAQVMSIEPGQGEPTGWHYHTCEAQFLYMLAGWLEMEFEGRGVLRFQAGDSIYIPGGTVHQELRCSDDFELLEMSVPAELGTTKCPPPSGAVVITDKG